jgi:hypothetical protein
MAPWIWDNIKVLYYWWLASAADRCIATGATLASGTNAAIAAVVSFVCVTLAGALDVAGIALRSIKYQVFDAAGLSFAELVKAQTAPRALIVHAPVHKHAGVSEWSSFTHGISRAHLDARASICGARRRNQTHLSGCT